MLLSGSGFMFKYTIYKEMYMITRSNGQEPSMTNSQLEALNRIKEMDKLFLNVDEIAPVLECNPQDIRGQARARPELLGFPVIVYCSRIKIPRLPFIQFVEELPCCCPSFKREVLEKVRKESPY